MRRAALLAVLVGGCLDAIEPEVGAPVALLCVDEDSDPAQAVSYRNDILPELEEYCFRCHSPEGAFPIGLEVGGLNLSTYAGLRTGGARSGASIVVPGRPCASIIVQKLGPAPPFGSRMPLGREPLEEEDLQLIHDWIAEGAHDN